MANHGEEGSTFFDLLSDGVLPRGRRAEASPARRRPPPHWLDAVDHEPSILQAHAAVWVAETPRPRQSSRPSRSRTPPSPASAANSQTGPRHPPPPPSAHSPIQSPRPPPAKWTSHSKGGTESGVIDYFQNLE
ncbi:hypothetical protein VPH35_028759 [Triticum aestivum]